MALRACAVGAIEAERSRFELWNVNSAIRTCQARRVKGLLAPNHRHLYQPASKLHRQSDRHFQAMLDSRLHQQAINHDFDGVIFAFVEIDLVLKVHQLAVDSGPGESVLDKLFHLLLELALASTDDRGHHHHAVFWRQRHHALYDLFRGLARNRASAFRTMGNSNGGVQKAKIVVDFGDRAYGRSWAAAGGLLLDRDRGAQAIDAVHVGSFHLIEELPGVSRQGLDIAALSLGVNRVEGERRFARPAQPGDNGERVPRD